MWKLLLFIVILLLVIIIMSWVNRFTIIRVQGESMSPTYRPGQILFVDRHISPEHILNFGKRVKKDAILVYYSPQGIPVIKRLINKADVNETESFLWFEGDNKDFSEDSRAYGFIKQERVYGEVVNFSTFLKRTFTCKPSDILEEEKTYG